MNDIIIREIRECKIDKMGGMLYEGIYQPDENNLISRDVLEIPEVNAYIKNFGTGKNNYCLIADSNREIAGIVRERVISGDVKGHGYIDDYTPEFVISLFKDYRDQIVASMKNNSNYNL